MAMCNLHLVRSVDCHVTIDMYDGLRKAIDFPDFLLICLYCTVKANKNGIFD